MALALRLGLERVGAIPPAVCGPLDEGPTLRANGVADSVAHAALGGSQQQ